MRKYIIVFLVVFLSIRPLNAQTILITEVLNPDSVLMAILDTIRIDDQFDRNRISEVENKYGKKSPEMRDLWRTIHVKDSINLLKVKEILDTRGWVGSDIIGAERSMTLFFVIQHSDLETQEYYYPILKDAVENQRADAWQLAFLKDRIEMRNGRLQIYGTQFTINPNTGEQYLYPLIDPDEVDVRRENVGLEPIAKHYKFNMGQDWSLDKYKENLPRYLEFETMKRK